jgi:hypothetical protein
MWLRAPAEPQTGRLPAINMDFRTLLAAVFTESENFNTLTEHFHKHLHAGIRLLAAWQARTATMPHNAAAAVTAAQSLASTLH